MGEPELGTAPGERGTAVVMSASESELVASVRFPAAGTAVTLTAPHGAAWHVEADGSAVLRDPALPAGTVGGLDVSQGVDPQGARVRVRLSTDSDGRAVRLDPAARQGTTFPITGQITIAMRAVDRVAWAEDLEGGRSLQVFPSSWGRSGSSAALEAVWESVTGLEPEAKTDVVRKQLQCHALGAPDKSSWNLEPWRPDVPYLEYLLAKCNPT